MREPNWLPFGHILEPPCLGRQVGGEQVPLRMLIKRVRCTTTKVHAKLEL